MERSSNCFSNLGSHQWVLRQELLGFALRTALHTEERLKCGVLPIDGLCRREAAWVSEERSYVKKRKSKSLQDYNNTKTT